MRTMHDGILIGIGTALNDDPQLNSQFIIIIQIKASSFLIPLSENFYLFYAAARHLPLRDEPYLLPRPIILDTHLRLNPACRLLANWRDNKGRRPWILTFKPKMTDEKFDEWARRHRALQEAGALIETIMLEEGVPRPPVVSHRCFCVAHPSHSTGKLSIPHMLSHLNGMNISSLMVEGGASVIESFLSSGCVDTMLVTVAPRVVGSAGVGYVVDKRNV